MCGCVYGVSGCVWVKGMSGWVDVSGEANYSINSKPLCIIW